MRELITETVKICVREYIERMDRGEAVLTSDQIDDMAQIGKIAFGIVYGDKKPDVSKAADTAITGLRMGCSGCSLGVRSLRNWTRRLYLLREMRSRSSDSQC